MSKRIDFHDLVDMIEKPIYVYHTDLNMGEWKILEYIHREKVDTLGFIDGNCYTIGNIIPYRNEEDCLEDNK